MIKLCAPAIIYLIFSSTQVIIDTTQGLYNTALMKIIVMSMVTILLNILCIQGLGIVSWIIVFIPFILMTIILGGLNFYYFLEIEHFSLLMIPISLLLSYSFLDKNYGIIATIFFYLTIIYSVIKFFILNPYQSL